MTSSRGNQTWYAWLSGWASSPSTDKTVTPSAFCSMSYGFACPQTSPMPRNLEEQIQQLCVDVRATDDDEELLRLCQELRDALQVHIRRLREQVSEFRGSSKPKRKKEN